MPQITANGLSLEYDIRGNPDDPTILLIMGLGAQMVLWPDPFCDMLAGRGFQVVRFDNRDIGLSQKLDDAGVPDTMKLLQQSMAGEPVDAPYRLEDMANDAAGLLEALNIPAAHVVGVSMGGMIAQLLAIHHPDKVLSLTSIMSSSGRVGLPPSTPEAGLALLSQPASSEKKDVVEHAVKLAAVIGSPAYPVPDENVRAFSEGVYDRSFYPAGLPRQYGAIIASGSRVDVLPKITVPTLVIHGADDPLLPVEHGEDTAALIPGAGLEVINGMGHNLPPGLYEKVVGLITDHAAQVEEKAA